MEYYNYLYIFINIKICRNIHIHINIYIIMYKYNMNIHMNIYIKYYIIILSHIVLYYIYACHIHGRLRGCWMSHEGNRSPHSQWDQQSNAILLN